jgi:hypothetical protein
MMYDSGMKANGKPNVFTAKLTELFESVEPQFRAATIERYRRHAELTHRSWLERMAKPKPADLRLAREALRLPEYTKSTKGSWNPTWEVMVQDIAAGLFIIDYARAEQDANRSVSSAKEHFIAKQSKKLANATKRRKGTPKLRGELKCDSVVTGHLMVLYNAQDHFILTMNMIVNHRYQRGYTSFYQFPARFTNVHIDGVLQTGSRISEFWMGENF